MLTARPGFYIYNLGCKLNKVESDTIAATLLAAGAVSLPASEAQVSIINTCTVTTEADHKSRKAIRKIGRICAGEVIVTGCAAVIYSSELAELGENVVVEPNKSLATRLALERLGLDQPRLDQLELDRLGDDQSRLEQLELDRLGDDQSSSDQPNLDQSNLDPRCPAQQNLNQHSLGHHNLDQKEQQGEAIEFSRVGEGFHTRVGIKIQDGCDRACTYCIVSRARGQSVSIPSDQVTKEVALAAQNGVSEVILTGINIGCYFDNVKSGCSHIPVHLPLLVDILLNRTKIKRIRLSSIEPQDVNDELISLLSKHKDRLCAHLHMPLQSGSDKVLQTMGRLYSTSDFAKTVEKIYEIRPGASLTTDVIVGFPQETEEDFVQTLEFCKAMRFSKIHVFRYSPRPDTPAALMDGQVDGQTKSDRAARLRLLSDNLRRDDMLRRVGKSEFVVMQSEVMGVSESYHEVVLEDSENGAMLVGSAESAGAAKSAEGVGGLAEAGQLIKLEFVGIKEDEPSSNMSLVGKRI